MPEPKERVKQDSSCRLFSGLERAAELVPRYCEISQVAIQVEDSSSARAVFDGRKQRKEKRKEGNRLIKDREGTQSNFGGGVQEGQ